jgi:hypothetical protein
MLVKESEPFRSIWSQLSGAERRDVVFTVLRGRAATDPFKSWLVVEFVNARLTPSFVWIPSILCILAGVAVSAFAWFEHHRLAWGPSAGLCVVVSLIPVVMSRYRRARKVNRPLSGVGSISLPN